MTPHRLSARALAARMEVPPNRIGAILRGRRGISGDTALRLARVFGTTPEFWMNLQSRWELETAADGAGAALDRIAPLAA